MMKGRTAVLSAAITTSQTQLSPAACTPVSMHRIFCQAKGIGQGLEVKDG